MPVGNSNILGQEFSSTRLPTQGTTDLDSQKRWILFRREGCHISETRSISVLMEGGGELSTQLSPSQRVNTWTQLSGYLPTFSPKDRKTQFLKLCVMSGTMDKVHTPSNSKHLKKCKYRLDI
jgi:hypothetical protein